MSAPNRTDVAESPVPTASTEPQALLIECLAVVDDVTDYVCRRRRLNADESEEFAGHVRLKLFEDHCSILRKFRKDCSLRTYLQIVIERLLLDFRIAQWGRWRPSVPAKRHGSVGVLLDRLMTRDGLTFDEAFTLLQTNYQVETNRDELYAISVQLPVRPLRRRVSENPESSAASYGDADGDLARREASRLAKQIKAALKTAVGRLTTAERQLLDMRYREGRQVVEIARALGESPKPLYRRLEHIVQKLRRPVCAVAAALGDADDSAFQLGDVSISW
jgi:RNA polymerase sigma factor (sigma-70 family)